MSSLEEELQIAEPVGQAPFKRCNQKVSTRARGEEITGIGAH